MKTTLITTKHGQYLLSRTKHGTSRLEELHIILAEDDNLSSEEIAKFVRDCETLRHKTKQARFSNSPHRFLRGLQQWSNNKQTQPGVLFFHDIDGPRAVMFATINYDKIRYVLKPFKISANRLISLHVRRFGFIHDGSATTLAAVTTQLSWLLSNQLVDRIQLTGVDTESPWFKYLITPDHNKRWRWFTIPISRWQTRLIDPQTGQRLKHYSAKTRYNFKRQDKILVKHFQGDVEVKSIVSVDEVDYFIREASRIVAQTYQVAIGIGVRANDEKQRAYLYELAGEGILRAYLLIAKGEAIAYAFGTLQSGTFTGDSTSYLPAYSKLSPGTVLHHRVMDLLADEGTLILDFGAGESNYKRILGSHQVNEVNFKLYAQRLQPTIAYALDLSFTRLNRWLNSLNFIQGNIKNALRRKWRNRLINNPKNKK
jgi:hypothetical protein